MKYTEKLGLKKPELPDGVSIEDFNHNSDVLENVVGGLSNEVESHLAESATFKDDTLDFISDYEYQPSTVVSRQIRTTKASDTAILKFKLDADISAGTGITISLDSGATSKPLIDIEGNNIIELTKDFVEVVADATFFTLKPRGSSNIKSIQRGSVTFGDSSTHTINTAINSVDLTKSIVKISVSASSITPTTICIKAKLTSATNIEFIRDTNLGSGITVVEWEVIEFNNVKSIQTGEVTINNGNASGTVTINSINTTKSSIFFSYKTNQFSNVAGASHMRGQITNATTLTFISGASSVGARIVAWQVLEFN